MTEHDDIPPDVKRKMQMDQFYHGTAFAEYDGEEYHRLDPTKMVKVEESEDFINEKITEQVNRVNGELRKLLALAYRYGYDGVDVVMDGQNVLRNPPDYSIGFKWEGWKGSPPTRDPFKTGRLTRYDFRVLNQRQERELLAVIGIQPEDIDRDA